MQNTADSGFSYGINQSAKEALCVPTSKDEKYKAKAFIDMFVQRLAKVLAIGVSLGITTYFADFSGKKVAFSFYDGDCICMDSCCAIRWKKVS